MIKPKNNILIIIYILIVLYSLFFVNCNTCKTIKNDCISYYGISNRDQKEENVVYKIRKKSIIISILGFETIFIPYFFLGKKLYEPIKKKDIMNDNR